MKNTQPMSKKIIKIFLLGAVVLHLFYAMVLYLTIQYTDNKHSERRLAMIAPHHFKVFTDGFVGEFTIDPMLKIYSEFELLPENVKQNIDKNWQGIETFHFDEDTEYLLFAEKVNTKHGMQLAYALVNIDAVEWDDNDFIIFQIVIYIVGTSLFAIVALFIVKMANRISEPFSLLAHELSEADRDDYRPLAAKGEKSAELDQMLASLNKYRQRVYKALNREQNFTRYISHELRTPMTVVRGCVSILHKSDEQKVLKQSLRIDKAITEMEQLTHTFLLLARDEDNSLVQTDVCEQFIADIIEGFARRIEANQVNFHSELSTDFQLKAEPVLVAAIVQNLLKNAINCSISGDVILTITPNCIKITDTGIGLNQQPRGYEGFGIGLNIVRDICTKYHWAFSLTNNTLQGCTAEVSFNAASKEG